MAKKENKTNAMRMLENAGIAYQVHTYDTDDGQETLDAYEAGFTAEESDTPEASGNAEE